METTTDNLTNEQIWELINSQITFMKHHTIEQLNETQWESICIHCQYLTEHFMETYQDKIDWHIISNRQKLSFPFIVKHVDKLNLFFLTINTHLQPMSDELKIFLKLRGAFNEHSTA